MANLEQARKIAHVPDSVVSLLDHFPTGSVTVILDSKSTLDERLGGERVALRVVSHNTAVRLIRGSRSNNSYQCKYFWKSARNDPAMVARSLSTDGSQIPFVSGLCGGCTQYLDIVGILHSLTRYYRNQGAERRFSEENGGF